MGIISYGNAKLGDWQQKYYLKLYNCEITQEENKYIRTQNIMLSSKTTILINESNHLRHQLNEHLKVKSKPLTAMTKEEFIEHCLMCGLDDVEIKIAELFIRQNLKGKELYDACGYSEPHIKRKRIEIKEKLKYKV